MGEKETLKRGLINASSECRFVGWGLKVAARIPLAESRSLGWQRGGVDLLPSGRTFPPEGQATASAAAAAVAAASAVLSSTTEGQKRSAPPGGIRRRTASTPPRWVCSSTLPAPASAPPGRENDGQRCAASLTRSFTPHHQATGGWQGHGSCFLAEEQSILS